MSHKAPTLGSVPVTRRSGRWTALLLVGLLALTGCARSPEAKKARYLERGNRFFSAAQYREAIIEYRKVLRIEGMNARAVEGLGLALYEVGEWQSAYRVLLKAEQLIPDGPDVRLKLGTLYLRGGRAEEAEQEAIAILDRSPSSLDGFALLAGAAQTPDAVRRAIERSTAAPADVRGKARFQIVVADLHLRRGDVASAERALGEAVAREPGSVDARSALGMLYALKGDRARADREFEVVRALTPADPARRLRLADFYLITRRPQEAKQVLWELTEKASDYLPAWRRRAELDLEEGRQDDALRAVDVVLRKSPMDLDARVLRGRAYLGKQMTAQAVQEFQEVLRREPRLPVVRYLLAQAHLRGRNTHQAKAELKEALILAPGFRRARLLLAEVNLQAGGIPAAIDDLRRLSMAPAADRRVYVLLGSAYLANGEPRSAIEVYRKFASGNPVEPQGPFLVGVALRADGKTAEARKEFESALSRDPTYADALAQLVSLDLAEGRPEAALERVQRQIARAPHAGRLHHVLGVVQEARREWVRAEAAYLEAIRDEPKAPAAHLALGRLYARLGKDDQALEHARAAVEADPNSGAALMLVGSLHERRSEITKAQEAYERVLALRPRFAPAANNLAYMYARHRGGQEKALPLAQMAREAAPHDPYVADTLGWVLYQRGMPERALNLLQESARKLPDNVEVLYHLGMAAAKVGDKELARRALTRAISFPGAFVGKEEAVKTLTDLVENERRARRRIPEAS